MSSVLSLRVRCVCIPEPGQPSVLHALCVVDRSCIVPLLRATFCLCLLRFEPAEVLFLSTRSREAKSKSRQRVDVPGRTDRDEQTFDSLTSGYSPLDSILTSSALLIGDWEGPEGLEEVDEATLATQAEELKSTRTYEPEPVRAPAPPPPPPESESDDGDSSSDEYVADGKGDPKRTTAKVRSTLG